MEKWLISDETGEPFHRCIACSMPLLELDRPWLITKEYLHNECVSEYAICQKCRDEVTARIPESSRVAVRAFLKTEINWPLRMEDFFIHNNRFSNCVACRIPRDETNGFAVSAFFDESGHLIEGPLPLLMCDACCSRMKAQLCEAGLRVWQEFVDNRLRTDQGGGWPGLW